MYINFWYVAAQSGEITFGAEKPLKVEMLGHHFALWRDQKGQVQCISDTCSHRGGALADGRVRGDCVECPYHGWTFNGNGECVRLPSLGPKARIPERTHVDSYPVQEKYGLIHVFLGDLPEAERPPIIDIPEYGDPAWRFIVLKMEWKIDYKRAVENTIDPGHNEFTHPTHGFLGTKDDYEVEDFPLTDQPWGTGFMKPMHAPTLAQRDMNEAAGRTGDKWIDGGAGNHGPHCTWTYIHPSEQAKMHGFAFHTPVHEKLDRIYVLFGAKFSRGPEVRPDLRESRRVHRRAGPLCARAGASEAHAPSQQDGVSRSRRQVHCPLPRVLPAMGGPRLAHKYCENARRQRYRGLCHPEPGPAPVQGLGVAGGTAGGSRAGLRRSQAGLIAP